MVSISKAPFLVEPIQMPCESPLYFCQLQVQENFNSYCEITNTVDVTSPKLNISRVKLVDTILGTSAEGQHLTGKKLVIIGVLDTKVVITHSEYACKNNRTKVAMTNSRYGNQQVINKTIPFSCYIVIPLQVCNSKHINIGYDIEDYSISILDRNNIFLNISLMLIYNDFEV